MFSIGAEVLSPVLSVWFIGEYFIKKVWCDEATENGCRRPGLTFTSWRCAGAARDGEVPVYLRLSRNRAPNVPVLHPWQERLSDKSDFNDFTPSEQALAGAIANSEGLSDILSFFICDLAFFP